MDPLIERFERLMRSFFQRESEPYEHLGHGRPSGDNRDYQEAWDELDEFLRRGSTSSGGEHRRRSSGMNNHGFSHRVPPESLRRDYSDLGVGFGAPFSEVREAYRSLIRSHHPDRHTTDADSQDRATKRSQRINEAFQRIKSWEEGKNPD